MSCLCGDTACPYCGPAQGHDPDFELVVEWLFEVVLNDPPSGFDCDWWAEELANRLGTDQGVADAMLLAAKHWERTK